MGLSVRIFIKAKNEKIHIAKASNKYLGDNDNICCKALVFSSFLEFE